jgi:N-formylglutamate amidohydrolase
MEKIVSADSLNHKTPLATQGYDVYYGLEPIILNFPHSGRLYPKNHLKFITPHAQSLRIFEDPYLDILLPDIKQCDTSYLINHCARVLIDVNRTLHQNHHKPMLNGEAMGLVPMAFPCGHPLYANGLHQYDIHARIDTYYKPYHAALEALIAFQHQQFKTLIVLDCHSMPAHGDKSDPDAFKARPDIVIGDNFGISASAQIVQKIEQSFVEMGLSVFRNFPYAGGYIVNHYGAAPKGIHVIQIEINRRLYVDKNTFELTEDAHIITHKFQAMLQKLKKYLGVFSL